jgi:hypothetical protein
VYRLRRPRPDGRTEILLSPLEFLQRLVELLAPPRKHRHGYWSVLAPGAKVRAAVTRTAGPPGTVLQALEHAGRDEDKRAGGTTAQGVAQLGPPLAVHLRGAAHSVPPLAGR